MAKVAASTTAATPRLRRVFKLMWKFLRPDEFMGVEKASRPGPLCAASVSEAVGAVLRTIPHSWCGAGSHQITLRVRRNMSRCDVGVRSLAARPRLLKWRLSQSPTIETA
jgi:hypothetical protein